MNIQYLFVGIIIFWSCQADVDIPASPPIRSVTWETHHDTDLNYTIQKPLSYLVEKKENQTIFSYQGVDMVILQHTDFAEMRTEPLWAIRNRTGRDSIFAELADVYQLDRAKRNSFSPAIGYAFPYKGKIFSIAFRKTGEELDPVQRMMLNTYRYYIPGAKF